MAVSGRDPEGSIYLVAHTGRPDNPGLVYVDPLPTNIFYPGNHFDRPIVSAGGSRVVVTGSNTVYVCPIPQLGECEMLPTLAGRPAYVATWMDVGFKGYMLYWHRVQGPTVQQYDPATARTTTAEPVFPMMRAATTSRYGLAVNRSRAFIAYDVLEGDERAIHLVSVSDGSVLSLSDPAPLAGSGSSVPAFEDVFAIEAFALGSDLGAEEVGVLVHGRRANESEAGLYLFVARGCRL